MEKQYHVAGMSCASCSAAVERIVRNMDGVTAANVNLLMETLTVQYDHVLPSDKLKEALRKAGFSLEELKQTQSRTFVVKGMFCAACSANVERILKRFDEIEEANVNLIMNNVTIRYHELQFVNWKKALDKAGFTLEDDADIRELSVSVEKMDE